MNFLKLLRKSKLAFLKENELELAYFYGTKYKKKRPNRTPKFKNIIYQILVFLYIAIKNFRFFNKTVTKKPIYVFSGSLNQLNSLVTTLKSLSKKNISYYLSAFPQTSFDKKIILKELDFITFNLKVFLVSLIIFFFRAIPLYIKIKKQKPGIDTSLCFSQFCQAYIFVPFFFDILDKIKPKIIIVSNDHNVSNRSLRLVAEVMNIKTLYMQHASVHSKFPPLEFDYAFLDGYFAYETYKKCYKLKKKNSRIKKNIAKCKVLLTGQKKLIITTLHKNKFKNLQIGIAVNLDTSLKSLKKLIYQLSRLKIHCTVRAHPSQDTSFLKELKLLIKEYDWLRFSNSKTQSPSNFFDNINILVAGDSGIHLEAAIAGIQTYFYDLSKVRKNFDSYDFVKNGISKRINKKFFLDLSNFFDKDKFNLSKRQVALKNYTETLGTCWQNREGELSAEIIDCILKNKSPQNFFMVQKSNVFNSVNFLKKK